MDVVSDPLQMRYSVLERRWAPNLLIHNCAAIWKKSIHRCISNLTDSLTDCWSTSFYWIINLYVKPVTDKNRICTMVTIHSACFLLRGAFDDSITSLGSELSLFLPFSFILSFAPIAFLLFLSFTSFFPFILSISLRISRTLQSLNITQKGCVRANVNGIALSMGDSSAIYLCLYFFS